MGPTRAPRHLAALLVATSLGACEHGDVKSESIEAPTLDVACPGGPTCPAGGNAAFKVGAAKREITPRGFEIAKVEFLGNASSTRCHAEMEQIFGLSRCGELHRSFQRNCGNDQICPDNFGPNLESGAAASDGLDNDGDGLVDAEDVAYVAPDTDGSEGDSLADGAPRLDFFHDCGLDRLCPDNVPETGAQASDGVDNDGDGAVDGADVAYPGPDEGEGDGVFQGLWIAGYGNNRPALGVHDPLWARAVVVSSGATTVAIVALDVVGFFNNEVRRLRQEVARQLQGSGVDVDYVLLASTHTHEAPDTMGQWGMANPAVSEDISDFPGRLPGYNAFIVAQAAAAVVEAAQGARTAELQIGQTRTGVEGFIRDGEDPQIIDDRMLVLRAVDASDGSTIATLVDWAQHPESLDSANNFVSSDYADALRRTVEEGVPAGELGPARAGLGGVCVYVQGMVGGIITPNGFDIVGYDGTLYPDRLPSGDRATRTFARTDAYGQRLGAIALGALDGAETAREGLVTVRAKTLTVPVDNIQFHLAWFRHLFDRDFLDWNPDAAIDLDNRPHLQTEVAVVEIGPVSLVTAPGEGFAELAIGGYDGSFTPGGAANLTRPDNPNPPDVSQAPGPPYWLDLVEGDYRFMVGLANDEIGYLVPPWRWELADNPWIDEAPGDHYCETNSTSVETVPALDQALREVAGFELPR